MESLNNNLEEFNNINENLMKDRGRGKIEKELYTSDGQIKKISSSQVGQKFIFDEAIFVFDDVKNWILNESGRNYRTGLKNYFFPLLNIPKDEWLKDEDENTFLLTKITEVFLFLSNDVYSNSIESGNKSRQGSVNTLVKYVLKELDFGLAWRFLEICIHFSNYFDVDKSVVTSNNGYNWKFKYVSTLNEEILSYLATKARMAFYPMPMTVKPKPWKIVDGVVTGGYKTYQHPMVRSKNKIDYTKFKKPVFDSINYIQSQPWVVNEDIVKVIENDLKHPIKSDYVKSVYPDPNPCRFDLDLKSEDLDIEETELLEIKSYRSKYTELLQLYNAEVSDYESEVGKYKAVKIAVEIAKEYFGKTIYFPHSFDFRGRIYPIAIGLSPQGSDAIKAMLNYSNGEKLNKEGEKWAWAYLTSLYGEDKLDFETRVKRGKELLSADYRDADEPYQFLSHQIELNKFLSDPDYEFNGRIHLDACNSGSQFTSAITRDLAGCKATNVIPTYSEDGSQLRQDAYLLVANKSLELTCELIETEQDEDRLEVLRLFKKLLEEKGRKICKRPVMVSNYGGTMGGRTDILWNMLRELKVDRKYITKKNAALFSRIIGDSIEGVLNGGKAFETYIHSMNDLISKSNKEIYWNTSDGFHVVHRKNKELKPKRVTCFLPNARKATGIIKKQFSKDVSSTKMKSAIAPNYIHSLDAELLRKTALKMKKEGIKQSDWIHDSFGCLPNHVEKMLHLTKSEFSKLSRRRPLKTLHSELVEQVIENKKNLEKLEEIQFPNLKGFDDKNGGLDEVFKSDWFFS